MNKSLIGLIAVSTVFLIYVTGFYTNFQSDSALEVIDFSIDKPASENSIPSNPIEFLFMVICMSIQSIHLMHIFLE